jgi:hypothetical protein
VEQNAEDADEVDERDDVPDVTPADRGRNGGAETGNDHQQIKDDQLNADRARRVNQRRQVDQNERRGDQELNVSDPREGLAVGQNDVTPALIQTQVVKKTNGSDPAGQGNGSSSFIELLLKSLIHVVLTHVGALQGERLVGKKRYQYNKSEKHPEAIE